MPTNTTSTKTAKTKALKAPKTMRPVIVCSNNAVLYGYTSCTTKKEITLHGCRWAYYWVNQGGHLGLASTGPQAESRIGSAGTITVGTIACVIEVTPEAAKVWDSFPVSTK